MTTAANPSTLPVLSPEEHAHCGRVAALVRERIVAAGGSIGFDEYLQLVLYAPGFGYYSAGSVKFGAAGDFVTAPELSPLFGRCVAQQCAQVLAETGGSILEFGAGTGRMAADVLQRLGSLGVLPERYRILEVSADLAARQRACLAALPAPLATRVEWLTSLPQGHRGVVLANEVLDALPFQRFVWRDGAVYELVVGVDERGTFRAREQRAGGALRAEVERIRAELPEPWPEDYVSELSPAIGPWVASLSGLLESGVILLFDYGLPRTHYYHPERARGTLRCHFRHRAHDDPFLHPGMQDVTAWVDFTRVAEAAVAGGLELAGFTTQAGFLLGCGIETLLQESADIAEHVRLAGEAQRLLLPGEMGESFKAMALARGVDAPLAGFSLQDLSASL